MAGVRGRIHQSGDETSAALISLQSLRAAEPCPSLADSG